MIRDTFRILLIDLAAGRGSVETLEGRDTYVGGSGLAALLFSKYGRPDQPRNSPDEPLIFAIGPLTGYFPLMSKTVCDFKSPYHTSTRRVTRAADQPWPCDLPTLTRWLLSARRQSLPALPLAREIWWYGSFPLSGEQTSSRQGRCAASSSSAAAATAPCSASERPARTDPPWHASTPTPTAISEGSNEFYRLLAQGTLKAAERHGGKGFACVPGQKMAGYATGEVFFASQVLGFRHSHLDSSGYSFDQKEKGKDLPKAVDFLVKDNQDRVLLTSMVACLFARGVYTDDLLARCLQCVGYKSIAENLGPVSRNIQQLRWTLRLASGFRAENVVIPERFYEVQTVKGLTDRSFLNSLIGEYAKAIHALGSAHSTGQENRYVDFAPCTVPGHCFARTVPYAIGDILLTA